MFEDSALDLWRQGDELVLGIFDGGAMLWT